MFPLIKSLDQIAATDLSPIEKREYEMATHRQSGLGQPMSGLITTSVAYWYFLDTAQLFDRLLYEQRNTTEKLSQVSERCRNLILSANIPYRFHTELMKVGKQLLFKDPLANEIEVVGIFVHEKIPTFSFPSLSGMSLKLHNLESLATGVKRVYASLFEEEVLLAIRKLGYRHMDLSVSCCISNSFRVNAV